MDAESAQETADLRKRLAEFARVPLVSSCARPSDTACMKSAVCGDEIVTKTLAALDQEDDGTEEPAS